MPVVVVIIAIVTFIMIRKKKKKKAQELLELEEDFDELKEDGLDDGQSENVETEKLSFWKKWKKRREEKRNSL